MIWLLNSPLYIRRVIALAILLACSLLLAGAVAAVWSPLATAHARLVEKRTSLGRLTQTLTRFSTSNVLQDQPDSIEYVDTFLTGRSEAVIRASMQEDFKTRAARSGVDVVSVGNAPALRRNDVVYLGIQANVTAKIANLRDFLVSLETATPILFIPQLSVRSVGSSNIRQQPVEQPLIAQFRVYAALDPNHQSIDTTDDLK